MKKRYLLLILILALSMVATACTSPKKEADDREKIIYTGGEPERAPALGDKDVVLVLDEDTQPYLDKAAEMEEWDVDPYFEELLAEEKITDEQYNNLVTAYYFNIPEGQ